jgi:hypothetical protein
MFGVLVVVLCRDRIAILSFSTGQHRISLIASLKVVGDIRRFGRAANGRAVAVEFLLFSHFSLFDWARTTLPAAL